MLVIDECGKFVIALLSGHLGGANELALRCAGYLKAVPVVTTATDLHSRFAVDVLQKEWLCYFSYEGCKGGFCGPSCGKEHWLYSEFPWDGELPEGLVLCGKDGRPSAAADPEKGEIAGEAPETGIAVTIHRGCLPFKNTVHVVPPAAVLGMGCRRKGCSLHPEGGRGMSERIGCLQRSAECHCQYRSEEGRGGTSFSGRSVAASVSDLYRGRAEGSAG